jgi:beta-glucosidase
LWEFGYGLSYTTYDYSNLKITPDRTGPYGEVKISCDIMNSGKVKGKEVVQLYIRDVKTTITRPVKELKGFDKILLEPGEKKTVEFVLNHESLGYYNRNMDFVVEPGTFQVMVGSSSQDIRLDAEFEIAD